MKILYTIVIEWESFGGPRSHQSWVSNTMWQIMEAGGKGGDL
jgi:hypothetical protein